MNKQKYCSFYVSDIHLVIMLLPYINEKIKENREIITIFETDISESVKKVRENINLEEFRAKKLMEIGWNNKRNIDELNLENTVVLVMGKNKFIEDVNIKLDSREESFTIVNCFEFMQSSEMIDGILNMHEKIINSRGENEIEEIFTEYTNKSNKKITIMK